MSKRGTFLVTAADEDSAVLRDVGAGQVHALASNPDVAEGDVLDATIAPEPPLEVTWTVEEISDRRSVAVERVAEAPTEAARAAARDLDTGEMETIETEAGETHVIAVPADRVEAAADEVADDDGTRERAVSLGAEHVSVRAGDGFVSVRYR